MNKTFKLFLSNILGFIAGVITYEVVSRLFSFIFDCFSLVPQFFELVIIGLTSAFVSLPVCKKICIANAHNKKIGYIFFIASYILLYFLLILPILFLPGLPNYMWAYPIIIVFYIFALVRSLNINLGKSKAVNATTNQSNFENSNEHLEIGETVMFNQDTPPAHVLQNTATPAKVTYCKHCGGAIDANKKCTGCGKQYFKPPDLRDVVSNPTLLWVIIVILVASLIVACNFSNYNLEAYNSKALVAEQLARDNTSLQQQLKVANENVETYNNRLSLMQERITECASKANFLDEGIALVTSTGRKYHKYDCQYFKGPYWAYNINAAEAQGYTPCQVCHDN